MESKGGMKSDGVKMRSLRRNADIYVWPGELWGWIYTVGEYYFKFVVRHGDGRWLRLLAFRLYREIVTVNEVFGISGMKSVKRGDRRIAEMNFKEGGLKSGVMKNLGRM
ncbi:hypothetical protein SUGI_0454760 [Cryptomeria japonica]|nr:hypothetical protein SUGI_0454760 [Cryptomeria japonica]